MRCLFVSDLHGRESRYEALFETIAAERPVAVFLGGDLLPGCLHEDAGPFLHSVLGGGLAALHERFGENFPHVFAIFGNDDPLAELPHLLALERRGLLQHAHGRGFGLGAYRVYGYACVPPTPFRLKDWERYDVSRFVDPGCIAPDEGAHSTIVDPAEIRAATIERELGELVGRDPLDRAILLCHSPPYRTTLDRAALDGRKVDHAPVDVHVGSVALRRLIEQRQPWLTLHGHVHESARLTGAWQDRIGRTLALGAAHDGPELALVRFDLDDPSTATRELK